MQINLRGGIRLQHSQWLFGFPPAIRLTGAAADAPLAVAIDGHAAVRGTDDNFTAPGWDRPGEHLVACEALTRSYSSDGLMSGAAATGIRICFDAPRTMLCALSRVCERYEEIADLPMGRDWVVEQFDPQSLRWKASSREEGLAMRDGLFHFRLSYQRRHFLRRRRRSYEMDGAAAKYALLRWRRRSVFRYVPASKECVIPACCRPPLLVERALILCSGHLHSFEASNATLTYRSVSLDVARLAARLLDQEILT